MSCNQVNILNYNHNVVKVSGDNFLTITNNNTCTSVTITQPVTNIIQVNSPGPQGPVGPKGADAVVGGDDMMIQYNSGSVLAGSPNLIFNYNTNTVILTGSLTVSSSNTFTNIGPAIFSGSVIVTDGITGSLYGTASWAENAITASYYNETDPIFNAASGGFTTTSSFNTFTSSYNTGSFTGNFSGSFSGSGADLFNIPASAIVGLNLSQIISGSVSASISPNGGLQVNTNVTAPSFTGSLQGTASWAENVISASYTLTASYAANVPATASYALQALSASYALSSSYSSNSNNATTASYILNAISASYATTSSQALSSSYAATASYAANIPATSSYALQALSASYAVTASYAPAYLPLTGGIINGNITVNGTASIAFLNVTYESASVIYSSGSNQFGDATNDTQTLIGTVIVSGSQQITGALYAPNITGSLYGTASWANNAITASYALTASYAANVPATASYALQALSASYALTASYVQNAQTASYVQNAQTASYVLQAVSASYALTASYISGSGGGSGAGFPYSGSAVITGSLLVTGSGLTVTGSTAISGTLTVNGIAAVGLSQDIVAGGTKAGGALLVGSSTLVTSLGYGTLQDNVIQLGDNISTNYYTHSPSMAFSTNQTGVGQLVGRLIGVNSSLGTSEKRVAQIGLHTDTATNNGKITLVVTNGTTFVSGITVKNSGNVGIQVDTPTAYLHIKAGTATANTAPLKLTSGTNLTIPENGAFEFDGTNLYFTVGGVRKIVTLT